MKTNKTTGLKCLVLIKQTNAKYIPLAGQRGASISRSAETVDVTSKDDGLWASSIAGYRSWSIDVDGAWIEGDAMLKAVDDAFKNGTPLEIAIFMNLERSGQGDSATFTAKEKYEGEVYVTDFSFDLPYDDLTSYSMTLQGTGELKRIDTNESVREAQSSSRKKDNIL